MLNSNERNLGLFRFGGAKKHGRVQLISQIKLTADSCVVGAQNYSVSAGNWAIYVPKLRLKLLHAVDGKQHCTTLSAPSREMVLSGDGFPMNPEYEPSDWQAAYKKSVLQRVAENIVCAERLEEAKLGPAVLGYCVVQTFKPWYAEPTFTAGYFVQNIFHKFPKRKTTLMDLARAGVVPDRINSCLRQQIRGYVSDLNSVVGVMPIDADREVAQIRSKLEQALISGRP